MNETASQYGDKEAAVYAETDEYPVRKWAEFPTFLGQLGSLDGRSVLDLACGTGILTRLVADHGAARVVGVDSSAPMIEQARLAGDRDGRIEYRVTDVSEMPVQGSFDAVTTGWLFNYAATREQLAGFCHVIAENLGHHGRLVATIATPDFESDATYARQYGVSIDMPQAKVDGATWTFTLHLSDPITIEVYYWTRPAYEAALREAGFEEIAFSTTVPTEEGIREMGAEYWQTWSTNPAITVLSATKAS